MTVSDQKADPASSGAELPGPPDLPAPGEPLRRSPSRLLREPRLARGRSPPALLLPREQAVPRKVLEPPALLVQVRARTIRRRQKALLALERGRVRAWVRTQRV